MVEEKLKAKLRNEICENCKYGQEYMLVVRKPGIKKRVLCTRHNHDKKFDKWCKFYEPKENSETRPKKAF